MTIEQLRVFLAVAELSHVTLAAQKLNMTQSAVSSAIKALETRHDVRLFNRIGRRIELSETGQAFRAKAEAVLARVREAEELLNDMSGLRRGHLRIWASQTVFSQWLPGPLVRFRARHPAITLETCVGNTEDCAAAVLEGSADLALVEGQSDAPHLLQQVVAEDQLVVVAAPHHPLAGGGARDLAELTGAQWVLRERGSGSRATFEAALRARGIEPARLAVDLELQTNEAILAALALGRHLGVVSRMLAAPLIASGQMVLLHEGGMAREFRLLRHRERHFSRAAEQLVAQLAAG